MRTIRNLLARWCFSLSYRLENWGDRLLAAPVIDDLFGDMACDRDITTEIHQRITANSPFLNLILEKKPSFGPAREKNEFEKLEGDDQL